jgi:hypothetical protein
MTGRFRGLAIAVQGQSFLGARSASPGTTMNSQRYAGPVVCVRRGLRLSCASFPLPFPRPRRSEGWRSAVRRARIEAGYGLPCRRGTGGSLAIGALASWRGMPCASRRSTSGFFRIRATLSGVFDQALNHHGLKPHPSASSWQEAQASGWSPVRREGRVTRPSDRTPHSAPSHDVS